MSKTQFQIIDILFFSTQSSHLYYQLYQLLAYAGNVNLIGDIRTIERNADMLLNACKDIGLPVNTGKTRYMEVGHHRGMLANDHYRGR